MKKLILTIMLLLMFTSSALAITPAEYRRTRHRLGSGNILLDPLYLHMVDAAASYGGIQTGTASKFFVDSSASAGAGTTWATAVNTIQEAVDLAEDNRGDIIYVAQDHAEDIASAAALDFDCPGITVIGIGDGEHQPTISLITAATATVQISAADVTLYNLRFIGNYTNGITECLDITADGDGARIIGCQFRETSLSKELLIMITVTAAADELVIVGNTFIGIATGTDSVAISLEGASDQTVIEDNTFYGDWSDYVIKNAAASISMLIKDNVINNLDDGAGKLMSFHANSTGSIINNKCYGNGTSYALVGDKMFVSLDNVFMQTENDETRNYESLLTDILTDTGTSLVAAIAALDDTGYVGECSTNTTDTQAICLGLSGFGNDYFNTGWSLVWLYNASSAGTYEGETQDITDYDSATGTFTLNVSSSEAITANDEIYIRRVEELNLNDTTMLGTAGGSILYVDSVRGATGSGAGDTWENAYATVALAEAACAAGDIVYISDGHDEEIGALLMNIANVSFIGMGEGDARPLLTCNDSTDEITLDAAGITVKNIRMEAGADKVTYAIRVEDAGIGCTIENVAFILGEGGNEEFEICVDVDALADKLVVRNCTYYNTNATAADVDSFIDLSEVAIQDTLIIGNIVFGDFVNGCIYWTTSVPLNLVITDNVLSNTTSTKYCINGSGAATGVWANNYLYSDSYSTMYEPGSLKAFNNWGTDATDQQAIRIPISADTSDVTGVADGSDLERLEYLQQLTIDALAFYDVGTGNVFYVDNAVAGSTGIDWANAVATIDDAVNLCTANAGDFIFVAPGHVEDLGTTDPDFDAANAHGVTCIGLGKGEQRPILSFDTSTDIFTIDADDVAIYNLVFLAHTPDVAKGIDITANSENAIIENCLFTVETEGTDEFLIAINVGADADNLVVENCEFFMGGGNATEAILFDGTCDYPVIKDNKIYGDYSTACIFGDSTGAGVMLTIIDNILMNGDQVIGLNTEPCIELKSDTTGVIINNNCFCDESTASAAIVAADCYLTGNTYSETEGTAGTHLVTNQFSEDPFYNRANYFIVEPGAFDTSGTWSTVAAHEIIAVTGAVRIRVIAECTTTLTDAGDAATLALGVAGNTAAIIASTSAGGAGAANQLDATEIWIDATPADLGTATFATAVLDFVVVGGLDVGYTIGGAALTGGVMVFHVWWEPLDSTGLCTAGAGGAF